MKNFLIPPLPDDAVERKIETVVRVSGDRLLTLVKTDDGKVYSLDRRFVLDLATEYSTNVTMRRACAKLCGWKMKDIDAARKAEKAAIRERNKKAEMSKMHRIAKTHGYMVERAK